jgi:hypothetical protein
LIFRLYLCSQMYAVSRLPSTDSINL